VQVRGDLPVPPDPADHDGTKLFVPGINAAVSGTDYATVACSAFIRGETLIATAVPGRRIAIDFPPVYRW